MVTGAIVSLYPDFKCPDSCTRPHLTSPTPRWFVSCDAFFVCSDKEVIQRPSNHLLLSKGLNPVPGIRVLGFYKSLTDKTLDEKKLSKSCFCIFTYNFAYGAFTAHPSKTLTPSVCFVCFLHIFVIAFSVLVEVCHFPLLARTQTIETDGDDVGEGMQSRTLKRRR